ncbi:hypothetical protein IV54_GL001611 [Levilactobacillus paucivorans]|uniref:YokE-like PH domain-containing protein n=1 Tax=Levilactobacillus paucivorans TaxID=616990 RepID=A0A0R2LY10_9LACO|nr:hypothetical protein IV54_GL001611 [Levilactobacillus paucivorans]
MDPKSFGKALNIKAVNRYRQALGYTSTDNLVVYGYMLNMGMTVLVGVVGMLANKYYMISFEDDGILFLGIGLSSHFTGENSFINFNDLEKISFKNFGLDYHLTVTAENGTMKAKVTRLILGQPWQAANVKILAQRYHK